MKTQISERQAMAMVQDMIETHPGKSDLDSQVMTACIEACFECGQSCTACADACLAEPGVRTLLRCIRTNQDCADICLATGRLLSRQTEPDSQCLKHLVRTCAVACETCGEECGKHGPAHRHCGHCAESCRRCHEACDRLIEAMG